MRCVQLPASPAEMGSCAAWTPLLSVASPCSKALLLRSLPLLLLSGTPGDVLMLLSGFCILRLPPVRTLLPVLCLGSSADPSSALQAGSSLQLDRSMALEVGVCRLLRTAVLVPGSGTAAAAASRDTAPRGSGSAAAAARLVLSCGVMPGGVLRETYVARSSRSRARSRCEKSLTCVTAKTSSAITTKFSSICWNIT